ncbi:MAG: helix-turn-helix domain-containing protein [Spirochaetales bacterium]|nr:helix-turn-helix domain-containing protein [Spirochaetales bacterium]
MDEKKLEVIKMVVSGEKSIAWAAVKLKRSEKTIQRLRKKLLNNPNADLVYANIESLPIRRITN